MILKHYRKISLLTILFLFFHCIIYAQLEVTDGDTPPFDPETILENYFFGGGVEVLDVTFNGAPGAVGFFDGTDSNIGIDRGIILTSGDADNAIGPNTVAGVTGSGFLEGEEDLEQLIPGFEIRDPAVYEIKFIPFDTIVRFNYVWGSDEYPEFVGGIYNDVFGFFISGPGINGPFTNNAENIAYLPDGVTPVSINNVNASINDEYYINNINGTTVEYDGFTVPLEASAIVIPCDTYNIKITVADAGDNLFDSGVFLASGSFGTDALNISVNTFSPDSTMVEGCVPAAVEFTLAIPTEVDLPIDYNIWGTAQNGIDYDPVPTSAIIPAGQDSLTLLFNPIEDGIAEGVEVIYLEVQTNICGKDTFAIYIDDNQLVPPELDDATLCEGQSLSVDATLPITLPASTTFTSNQSVDITDNQPTNPIYSTIDIFGAIPEQIVEGSILSVCIDITHSYVGDLDIYLISPNDKFLNLSTDNGGSGDNFEQACFTLDASTLIQGLVSADTPFTGDYLPESPWEDIYGATMNGTWTLQISDDSNGFTGTLNSWSITIPPIYGIAYTWEPTEGVSDPNAPDVELSPTETTTYYVIATDTYGCSTMDSMTVNVSPGLTAPVVTCDNSVNGQLTFSWDVIQGATAYEINVNGTGWVIPSDNLAHFIAGLSDGQVVTVQVRGVSIGTCPSLSTTLSCTAINPGCALLANIDATQDVSCNGDTDGSATVSVTGGAAPYTYTLNGTSQSNGTFTNLAAGNYAISIEDNLGCTTTQTVMIGEPDVLELTFINTNADCNGGNDGTITLTASGGTPDYSYSLDNINFTNNNIFQNLNTGTYTAYVNDANDCTASVEVTISEPDVLGLTSINTNVNCNGANDGTITLTASGGTPDYMYSLDNINFQNNNIFQNLNTGNYTAYVNDANDCTAFVEVTITEPDAIVLITSNTSASCNGGTDGTATVEATNGEAPYNYQWDSNANNQTTQTATGLPFGSYTVTVTDNSGCTATTIASVPELSSLEYTIAGSELDCNGDTNGTASVTVTAGTMPYNYEWNNGEMTESISGLSGGTYTITITDGGGCSAVDNIEVIEPELLTLDLISTDALCNGDTVSIVSTTAGGTSPHSYQWSNGDTTPDISATAGAYTCTVTDAKGCTTTAQANISEPDPLILNYTNTNIDCNGTNDGTITLTANGGTPDYMYSLDNVNFQNNNIFENLNAGIYNVYVNDANDCSAMQEVTITESFTIVLMMNSTAETCDGNDGTATVTAANGAGDYTYLWTGGQSTATANMLNAGIYTVTVTDANDCIAIDSIEVTSSANIELGATATDVSCFGAADGEGIVIADNGVPPYTYLWDANAGNQTSASATGLSVGTYTVEVTDSTGCTATTNVIINESDQLILTIEGENLTCSGEANGAASVTPSGGTGTYLYEWNDGQSISQITDLFAGDYSVTVTDTNGCQETATVTLTQPSESISINAVGSAVNCFGDSNGTITVNAAGGTPPYVYSLDNENFTTSNMLSGLSAGTYTVYAQDATGDCLANTTATVTEPPELLVDAGEDIELTYGDSITLTATPNLPGDYTYSWFSFSPEWNLSCTDCAEPLATPFYQTGYTVTIANENGCEATDDINIYIKKEQLVFVANAFTPNADGTNDFLYVQGSVAAEEVTVFQIYDRWGELVFDNRNIALNDKEAGWDGTLKGQEMNPAVFVWYAEVRFVDGSVLPYTGNSTLIR